MLLILDLQIGLYQLARNFDDSLYQHNMIAHSTLGKVFDIPVVMTTSAQQDRHIPLFHPSLERKTIDCYEIAGPKGPLPAEILEMCPDVPLVTRQGEVDV